jgi:hypothetical protein
MNGERKMSVEEARRVLAHAERVAAKVEQVKKLIETFLGLSIASETRYERHQAASYTVASPTGKVVWNFDLRWDDEAVVTIASQKGQEQEWLEELQFEVKRLNTRREG